jgi:hypothetical protein
MKKRPGFDEQKLKVGGWNGPYIPGGNLPNLPTIQLSEPNLVTSGWSDTLLSLLFYQFLKRLISKFSKVSDHPLVTKFGSLSWMVGKFGKLPPGMYGPFQPPTFNFCSSNPGLFFILDAQSISI